MIKNVDVTFDKLIFLNQVTLVSDFTLTMFLTALILQYNLISKFTKLKTFQAELGLIFRTLIFIYVRNI